VTSSAAVKTRTVRRGSPRSPFRGSRRSSFGHVRFVEVGAQTLTDDSPPGGRFRADGSGSGRRRRRTAQTLLTEESRGLRSRPSSHRCGQIIPLAIMATCSSRHASSSPREHLRPNLPTGLDLHAGSSVYGRLELNPHGSGPTSMLTAMSYVRVGVGRMAWGSEKEEVAIVALDDRTSSRAIRLPPRTACCCGRNTCSLALQSRTAPI
jgi:hypothetical protein